MHSEFYIIFLFAVFPTISSEILPGFGEYNGSISSSYSTSYSWYFLDDTVYNFTFPLRLPHLIGDKLRYQQLVIRTFPTEIEDSKDNTELTKNISLEMEASCGSSKSEFDKTDVVTLTLMEKQSNTSIIVKTIQVDPLSVDFYSPRITMKQFVMLAEDERKKRTEFCADLCNWEKLFRIRSPPSKRTSMICPKGACTCLGTSGDHTQSLVEMEKFVKIMKYLELFQDNSSSCQLKLWHRYESIGTVELDKKTASTLPKLNHNHYIVASFTDTKRAKSAALILKDFKII